MYSQQTKIAPAGRTRYLVQQLFTLLVPVARALLQVLIEEVYICILVAVSIVYLVVY